MTMPASPLETDSRMRESRLSSPQSRPAPEMKISSPPCSHWEMVEVVQMNGQEICR